VIAVIEITHAILGTLFVYKFQAMKRFRNPPTKRKRDRVEVLHINIIERIRYAPPTICRYIKASKGDGLKVTFSESLKPQLPQKLNSSWFLKPHFLHLIKLIPYVSIGLVYLDFIIRILNLSSNQVR